MIALIDYDSGNLRSVHRALLKVGAEVRVVRDPDGMRDAHALVLPGVGAFDDCIHSLQRQALLEAVKTDVQKGKPFLGICVGYQALFESSEEYNSCAAGMSVFQGKVIKFPENQGLKIPQIGWNQIELQRDDCPIFQGISTGDYVYFVHSFHPQPADDSIVATRTEYGRKFASSVWKDNIFATQFHPEKSQAIGLKLLDNFVRFAAKN